MRIKFKNGLEQKYCFNPFVCSFFEEMLVRPEETRIVVCFVAFFANDIYGFVNWRKMKIRQQGVRASVALFFYLYETDFG